MPRAGAGGGAVSRRNCSIAAAIAAASCGVAAPRRHLDARARRVLPAVAAHAGPGYLPAAGGIRSGGGRAAPVHPTTPSCAPYLPGEAIERVREGFVEHTSGIWEMPAKTYLDAPPSGDFRAMPARGAGIAILKWVTSFPAQPGGRPPRRDGGHLRLVARGRGAARAGGRARGHRAAHGRGGGGGGPGARAARRGVGRASSGCGLHGSWAARCLAEAEYGPGVCFDPDPDAAGRLAGELGWEVGGVRRRARLRRRDLRDAGRRAGDPQGADVRPGVHLNMLGADGPGKAEAEPAAVAAASSSATSGSRPARRRAHGRGGGRPGGAGRVTELGYVLTGAAGGRSRPRRPRSSTARG